MLFLLKFSSVTVSLNMFGVIAFNVLMLVGCILTAAVMDTDIRVVLATDKVTLKPILFILVNFLLVGIVLLVLAHIKASHSSGAGEHRPPSTTSGVLHHCPLSPVWCMCTGLTLAQPHS